jgi:hypothetical protein
LFACPKITKPSAKWLQFLLKRSRHHQKQAAENRREFKDYKNDYDDLFNGFFYNTDDLIRILDELVVWRPQKLKSRMIKASSKRLAILRDLINLWLISGNLTIHDIAKLRQQQSSGA